MQVKQISLKGEISLESSEHKHVLVIGAGIVGVSTALWLQRDGHAVTLIDKEGPAAGASFGGVKIMSDAT